nr:hypothetical protein [Tanacetum cinerariifolium]
MYHKKNVDFAYLQWEDFVYQVEHKDAKKSNEMYYPGSQRDDQMFTTIKLVSRHQNTQQSAVMLLVELTNEDIRNSKAYKEYYAIASGAAPPKTKASVMKMKSSSDTTITPPTAAGTRLSTSKKGKQHAKASKAKDEGTGYIPRVLDVPTDESDEEISWKSSDEDDDEFNERSDNQDEDDDQDDDDLDDDDQDDNENDQDTDNDGDDFVHPKLSIHEEEAKHEESFDPIVQTSKNSNDEGSDDASLGLNVGDVHTTQEYEDTHVTQTPVNPDGQQQSSSVSSQFVTSMLNPSPYAGINSLFETTPRVDVQAVDVQASTTDLPNFGSLFGFDHRLKTLEANFSKFMQTNQFAGAVSSILGIVERYMDQRMNEAVKTMNEQLEAKVLTRSSNSSKTSYVVAADLLEMELKKILIEKMESNKPGVQKKKRRKRARVNKRSKVEGATDDQPITEASQHPEWFQQQKKPPTPNHTWNKTLPATHESIQPWISDLAKQADSHSSFNELMDTPVNFLAFLMNRLKVDTLTPELLAGPTYELMKGLCKNNLLKPLPLIPNSRGRRVIPFDHFINNDLEYLCGGASSRKYITFVTKTKAAYYGHIKWIEDLVPRTMWSQELIVKWHNYKHLDWITVHRDDGKLYKFKEGNFKRLHIQDIEDMLLLLVQGKLINLMVEERFVFNVSLRMFTRSIIIQRRVEDLQLGVKSYQKKLNLIKPDTYYSDIKRKEAYTTYSNPRAFSYQNKDKQNGLMRIDELHKFSNGTLSDVRTALDDRLKGIKMKYLPQAIWRKLTRKEQHQ